MLFKPGPQLLRADLWLTISGLTRTLTMLPVWQHLHSQLIAQNCVATAHPSSDARDCCRVALVQVNSRRVSRALALVAVGSSRAVVVRHALYILINYFTLIYINSCSARCLFNKNRICNFIISFPLRTFLCVTFTLFTANRHALSYVN